MVGFSIKVRKQLNKFSYSVYYRGQLIAADHLFETASAAYARAEHWVFAYRAAYAQV